MVSLCLPIQSLYAATEPRSLITAARPCVYVLPLLADPLHTVDAGPRQAARVELIVFSYKVQGMIAFFIDA